MSDQADARRVAMSRRALAPALAAGAVYFFLVALVHTMGWHVPGLFIFFDVPSQAFQDQIIGLLAFGWALWLAESARRCRRDPHASITPLLVAGAVAIVALARIVLLTPLPTSTPSTGWYWVQIGVLAAYISLLAALSRARAS